MTADRLELARLVARVGGELYDGGRRALVRGPGHGPGDRSLSLRLADGRLLAHSFAGDDWRDIRAYLAGAGLRGPQLPRGGEPPPAPRGPERLAMARELWALARPAPGTLAEAHARGRAVARPLPPALRFHPAVPSAIYARAGRRRPALVAAIRDVSGALAGVEVTYLAADGCAAAGVRRKTVGGRPAGAAVRLDPPAASMAVAEGVFSALSASQALGLPAWALLAVGNLAAWTPPAGVRRVLIAADRGRAGERGAQALHGRLVGQGLSAELRWPPAPHQDWNDWAQAAAREGGEGRTGKGGPEGRMGRPPAEEPSR